MGRRWERGRLGGREIIQHSLFCPGAGVCNYNSHSHGVSFYRGAIISRNLSITYFTLPTLTWCQDLLFNCWSCFRVSWFCNINPGSSQLARHDLQSQQTFHFFLRFLSRVKDRLGIVLCLLVLSHVISTHFSVICGLHSQSIRLLFMCPCSFSGVNTDVLLFSLPSYGLHCLIQGIR